jgi:hypothetical protein
MSATEAKGSPSAAIDDLDRLTKESGEPRPHGLGGSAEVHVDLNPERVVMVVAPKTYAPAAEYGGEAITVLPIRRRRRGFLRGIVRPFKLR